MAVIWNSADASSNISLSGGNLTATTTNSAQGGVRGNTSFSTGKKYFETQLAVVAGSNFGIGWANGAANLSTFIGADTNSVALRANSSLSNFEFKGVAQTTNLGSMGIPLLTLQIAFDIGNLLIWARYNNAYWNGSATATPATGVGGLSLAGIAVGPYFPVFCANGSGASVNANFGATSFGYPIPSGFSGLDTNTQTYVATSKFLGFSVQDPPTSAASVSKMDGYGVLWPPTPTISVSKLLSYAILVPQAPVVVPGRRWLADIGPVRKY